MKTTESNCYKIKKQVLFGGHRVGMTNAKKAKKCQHAADAMNAPGSRKVSPSLKWKKKNQSDMKVEVKRHVAVHRQSVCAITGRKGTVELNLLH